MDPDEPDEISDAQMEVEMNQMQAQMNLDEPGPYTGVQAPAATSRSIPAIPLVITS